MNERLLWIDCEMTGLDTGTDHLIEIAALVTDNDLNPLDDGFSTVIAAPDAALDAMIEVVAQMHARSGLTDDVRTATSTLAEAEELLLTYAAMHLPGGRIVLAGNSIATDRRFLERDMPQFAELLHYRMLDVSAVKELCRRWFPRIYFGQPTKGLAHRALADIHESITELRYYRQIAFVPDPGPSTAEVQLAAEAAIAAAVIPPAPR